MTSPGISVVIPSFNHADYLPEAVTSVLNQTYRQFELIVVDDGSMDDTLSVMERFQDERITCIVHQTNEGLSAARNSGIKNSSADLVAFLDADDVFHPEKLEIHVKFLRNHPDVDVSYNSRFELNYSSSTIRNLWTPPSRVYLADIILGYPFVPSDMVIRKDKLYDAGLLDEAYGFFGEDRILFGRLMLSGCRFAGVDRALNYRRHESGRKFDNIPQSVDAMIKALDDVLNDPRCPESAMDLRPRALRIIYLDWAWRAFSQDATSIGRELLHEAIRYDASILEDKPCHLLRHLVARCTADENQDHGMQLRHMLDQFPEDLTWLAKHLDWAVARGYLIKGTRSIMWGRLTDGRAYFKRAIELRATIDEGYIGESAAHICNFESEFGEQATTKFLDEFLPWVGKCGGRRSVQKLLGLYSVNQGFRKYRGEKYREAIREMSRAVMHDPKYLINPGVMTVLAKSMLRA
jgi:glycosyltransferase involved in cell wall biosynthesis